MSAATGQVAAYRDGVAWARGPQQVYDRLASAALSPLPDRLDGMTALDVGAGTGAASRELLRRGANVLAVDTSVSMLAELVRQTDGRVPTIVSDIRRLAVPYGGFAVTVAAFVLNHVADPAASVRELARVTRRGGRVVATTFRADDHPIKAAVDAALVRYGYAHPQWYRTLKQDSVPRTATPAALAAVATDGGLAEFTVDETDVDLSDLPVSAAIAYRLGLAHIAPFVASLDATDWARLNAELTGVVSAMPPLRLPMLVLSGRR